VRAGDREGYHALNKPFHEAIYAGTHNGYLMEQARHLYHRLAPYRAYQLQQPRALQNAFREHQQIVDAIIAGDGDAAYGRLFDHVRLDSDLFSDLVVALGISTDKPPMGNGRSRLASPHRG
jgi:DNA-binding GntR family transcriptional regulator